MLPLVLTVPTACATPPSSSDSSLTSTTLLSLLLSAPALVPSAAPLPSSLESNLPEFALPSWPRPEFLVRVPSPLLPLPAPVPVLLVALVQVAANLLAPAPAPRVLPVLCLFSPSKSVPTPLESLLSLPSSLALLLFFCKRFDFIMHCWSVDLMFQNK
jgi:hypothetical protein